MPVDKETRFLSRDKNGLPHLIGITGAAGSGKDTAAVILTLQHLYQRIAFATPIKEAVAAMLGCPVHMWEDRAWKEETIRSIGKSPRELAQTLGTEWGRDTVKDSIWVDLAMAKWERNCEQWSLDKAVFTDVRFNNEAERIREQGGIVIGIVRQTAYKVAEHSSETGVDEELIDEVFPNNAKPADLQEAVLNYVRGFENG